MRSEDQSFYAFPFGTSQDVAMAGDFDGDGKADPTVYRSTNKTWYTLKSTNGEVETRIFGAQGDSPKIGDFDGDGKHDIAIYRSSTQNWWINQSTDGVVVYNFGADIKDIHSLLPADYTGDGKTDLAFSTNVLGSTNLEWFILRSEDLSFYSFPFGRGGDSPAVGDYDGDGKADAAVYRKTQRTWYIQESTDGTKILSFGNNTDIPIALYPATY